MPIIDKLPANLREDLDVPLKKFDHVKINEQVFEQLPDQMSLKISQLELDITSVEDWAIKCSTENDYIYCVPELGLIFQKSKRKIHRFELSPGVNRFEVKSWQAYHQDLPENSTNICSIKFDGNELDFPLSLNGDNFRISIYGNNPDAIQNRIVPIKIEKGI